MPTSLACFDQALVHGIPETEQTFNSPDLFTRHPVQDGLQMHLKGMLRSPDPLYALLMPWIASHAPPEQGQQV